MDNGSYVEPKIDAELSRLFAEDRRAPSAERLDQTLAEMKRGLRPVHPLAGSLALRVFAAFLVLALGAVMTLGVNGWDRLSGSQQALVLLGLIAGAGAGSLWLAWEMIPGSLRRFQGAAVMAGIGVALLAGFALVFPWQVPDQFTAMGWWCAKRGLIASAASAVVLGLLVRRGAMLSGARCGAAVGSIAGLVGVTVLQFKCMHQDALHVVVWHLGVFLVSGLVGAGVGALWARLRA